MKSKLILLLALSFIMFSGCSTEETFTKGEQSNSNAFSKTLDWLDEDVDDGTSNNEISSNFYYVLVQYPKSYSVAQINSSRNYHAPYVGLISYYNCNPSIKSKEVWTVDVTLWQSYCCLDVNIEFGQPKTASFEDDDDVSLDDVSLDEFIDEICNEGNTNTTN